MDSLKENQISYETPDFTLLNDLIKKEEQKNIDNENNPRIKELLEEIKSTNDEYEIIQLCARIHEHDPDNVMAFIHQGEQFTYFGELEKAQDSFEKAVQKANGTSAFVYVMFAIFLYGVGDPTRALDNCNKSIEIQNNDSLSAQSLKGKILFEKEKYADALDCFNNALHDDEDNLDAWDGKSQSLIELGRFDDAIACIHDGLKISEKNANLINNLGIYCFNYKQSANVQEFLGYLPDNDPEIAQKITDFIHELNQSCKQVRKTKNEKN